MKIEEFVADVHPDAIIHCDHGVSLSLPCEQCRHPGSAMSAVAPSVSGWRLYCGNVRLAAVFFVHVLFGGRVCFYIPFRSAAEFVLAYAKRTPFEMRMTIREGRR